MLRSISDGAFTVDTREEALGKPCSTIFQSDISKDACALRYTMETGQPIVDLVTRRPRLRAVLELLPTIAESESTVLITGESGTGKELVDCNR